ncbi:hypothetical protein ABIA30_002942 [Mycobacterium sp. MAA66]|uniref:8-oxoguanine DNA glycosylase OGG fold protein n=1 Tax=Mycobacterium sp. MAA66 TaxID=3156297 RepID=UPI00351805C8
MAATNLADVRLPDNAVAEIHAASPVQWIDEHAVVVGHRWWTATLTKYGLQDTILGDTISRADIFALADPAVDDPAAALTLLWNALAWGSGTKRRNNKARIGSVAHDSPAAGVLLQQAAQISRSDPLRAYDLLYPSNKTALPHLGPAFFTKYLYFAGAGHPDHRCCILDENVALALRDACGWSTLPTSAWPATSYERYVQLLDRWIADYQLPRRDMIERWLFEHGKTLPRRRHVSSEVN